MIGRRWFRGGETGRVFVFFCPFRLKQDLMTNVSIVFPLEKNEMKVAQIKNGEVRNIFYNARLW